MASTVELANQVLPEPEKRLSSHVEAIKEGAHDQFGLTEDDYSFLNNFSPEKKRKAVRKCLACLGLYPINPCGNAWNLNNLAGPTKRAMGIAFMLCIGNVGGIIGSYIYMDKEKPKYKTGFGASLGFAAAGVVACLTIEMIYKRINDKRSLISEDEIFAKYTQDESEAMGDRSPLFRYTL